MQLCSHATKSTGELCRKYTSRRENAVNQVTQHLRCVLAAADALRLDIEITYGSHYFCRLEGIVIACGGLIVAQLPRLAEAHRRHQRCLALVRGKMIHKQIGEQRENTARNSLRRIRLGIGLEILHYLHSFAEIARHYGIDQLVAVEILRDAYVALYRFGGDSGFRREHHGKLSHGIMHFRQIRT